jgi:ubiquinone/menaquinone biosynthesis C-methylase UbiE
VELINWADLWKFRLAATHRNGLGTSDYWDKFATCFNEKMVHMQDLTNAQLCKMQLLPEHTLLDIGAGTGRLTIPIAKRVKQVTAVEPSANMFALLKSNVEKENLHNIVPVNSSCEELNIDNGVYPHDVVIASFSLFMADISNALQKMNALAKKRVYLFSSASMWMSEELQKIIYGNILPFKSGDYIYVYNILHDLGILANVEVWNFKSIQCFTDLDEAVSKFTEPHKISPSKEAELRTHLHELLVKENGKLWLKSERKAAVIWWTKT